MEAVFQDVVQRVRDAGRSVLLSSHILSEVEALCDRVTIIRAGRAAESGTFDELRHLTRTSVVVDTARPLRVGGTLARRPRRPGDDGHARVQRRPRRAEPRPRAPGRTRGAVDDQLAAHPRGAVHAALRRGHIGACRGFRDAEAVTHDERASPARAGWSASRFGATGSSCPHGSSAWPGSWLPRPRCSRPATPSTPQLLAPDTRIVVENPGMRVLGLVTGPSIGGYTHASRRPDPRRARRDDEHASQSSGTPVRRGARSRGDGGCRRGRPLRVTGGGGDRRVGCQPRPGRDARARHGGRRPARDRLPGRRLIDRRALVSPSPASPR